MKNLLLAIAGLLGIAGTFVGLAEKGVVNVPYLSPIKFGKKLAASADPVGGLLATIAQPFSNVSAQVVAYQKAQASKKPVTPPTPPPPTDPTLGVAKIAGLWNGMDAAQLVKLTESWKPADLAPVLLKMDDDQVTKYLGLLDPARANAVCKAIQAQASVLPTAPASS